MVVQRVKEESRERDVAKGNGTKREGWVETPAKSLNEQGRERRVGGGSGRQ